MFHFVVNDEVTKEADRIIYYRSFSFFFCPLVPYCLVQFINKPSFFVRVYGWYRYTRTYSGYLRENDVREQGGYIACVQIKKSQMQPYHFDVWQTDILIQFQNELVIFFINTQFLLYRIYGGVGEKRNGKKSRQKKYTRWFSFL